MSLGTTVFAIAVGLGVGIIVGALGAGGGILSVPILVYLLGQEPHDAAAGSLVIVGMTALVSIIPHLRAGMVRIRDGLIFGALSLVGAVAGSRLSVVVDEKVLLTAFGCLLLGVGALMLVKANRARHGISRPARSGGSSPKLLVLIAAATATGFLTGFFGVGGGFAVVPMLVLALAIPMREAVGTSLLVMIMASATGLVSRIGTGVTIDWPIILAFALASMVGGMLGQPLSRKVPESTLTAAFGVLLEVVAVATLVETALAVLA